MISVKIFADHHTKAFKDVQPEDEGCTLILQKDVDSLCDWPLKWQLKFNSTKCRRSTLMTYDKPKIRTPYKMKEGDGKLTDTRHDDEAENRHLGLCLTESCHSDSTLIESIIVKVNRMIVLTRRSFHYVNE